MLDFLSRNLPPLIHPGGSLEVVNIAGDAAGSLGVAIAEGLRSAHIRDDSPIVQRYMQLWFGDSGDAMRARGSVGSQLAFLEGVLSVAFGYSSLDAKKEAVRSILDFEAEFMRRAAELPLGGQASVEGLQSLRRANWVFRRITAEIKLRGAQSGEGATQCNTWVTLCVQWYTGWLAWNSIGASQPRTPPLAVDPKKLHPSMRFILSEPERRERKRSEVRKGIMWLAIHDDRFKYELHECLQNGLRMMNLYRCDNVEVGGVKAKEVLERTYRFVGMLLKIGTRNQFFHPSKHLFFKIKYGTENFILIYMMYS